MSKIWMILVLSGGLILSIGAAAQGRWDRSGPRGGGDGGGARAVPELNAETAGAALALVAGGVAVVLGRRRRTVKP